MPCGCFMMVLTSQGMLSQSPGRTTIQPEHPMLQQPFDPRCCWYMQSTCNNTCLEQSIYFKSSGSLQSLTLLAADKLHRLATSLSFFRAAVSPSPCGVLPYADLPGVTPPWMGTDQMAQSPAPFSQLSPADLLLCSSGPHPLAKGPDAGQAHLAPSNRSTSREAGLYAPAQPVSPFIASSAAAQTSQARKQHQDSLLGQRDELIQDRKDAGEERQLEDGHVDLKPSLLQDSCSYHH